MTSAVVELLDRANQTQCAFLDQVKKREPGTAIPLRDRDHEPQVRLNHLTLGAQVATFDPLRERHLLIGCQERDASDRLEVQLQRTERFLGSSEPRGRGLVLDDVQPGGQRIALGPDRQLDPELSQIPAEALELPPRQLDIFQLTDDLLVSEKTLLSRQRHEPSQSVRVAREGAARCYR